MRAAASSTARGSPSRRRLSSATASALAGDSSKRASAAWARTTNSWTAGIAAKLATVQDASSAPGTGKGRTSTTCSRRSRSGSRLVARTVRLGTSRQQSVEVRRGGQQMLQVVHHQQDRPLPEERRQRCEGILRRLLAHPHHPGDRRHHQSGIGQRRQIHEPDAIREALRHLLRGGNRQARLADASGADQRQQANVVLGEEAADEGQLVLAPDQSRRLRREMHGDAGRGGGRHGAPSVVRGPRCDHAGGWSEAGGRSGHHPGGKLPQRRHLCRNDSDGYMRSPA